MKYCNYCEKEVENWVEVDGDFYCQDCLDTLDDIVYCEDCGEYHYYDNTVYIQDIHSCVCESCARNGDYFLCHDCGEWYTSDYANSCYNGEFYVCDRCSDNYTYVECCDTLIENAYYSEEDDCCYCETHYHENRDICDYHGFSDWKKHTLENENPPYYIGFELEIENTHRDYDNNDLARFAKNNYPVICSRDGSIDFGFEIVSHPLSYNYIVENKGKLKSMLEGLSNKGCESHNPGTCGLHFHVTHPRNDDIIDRIILIMETYKQELISFSRRSSDQIDNWCKFLSDVKYGEDCKSLYFIKKNKETSNRYMALNLTNYNTIEFRLFRGTLKFDTFMASVELVNNIMTLCSDLSIPVEEITWDRLTETQYANTYCDMKNIRSTIVPKSNDEEYLKMDKKQNEFREKVCDTLDNKILPLLQQNLIQNNLFTVTDYDLFKDELNLFKWKLSSIEEFTNMLRTIEYYCVNKERVSFNDLLTKISTSKLYVPQINNNEEINNIMSALLKEGQSLLGKESE